MNKKPYYRTISFKNLKQNYSAEIRVLFKIHYIFITLTRYISFTNSLEENYQNYFSFYRFMSKLKRVTSNENFFKHSYK